MENKKLQVSVTDRKVITSDGFIYPLSQQFLNLYFFLAMIRIKDPERNGGFARLEQILSLPKWEDNQMINIGKNIRRHIKAMEDIGRNIIEFEQKIKGPFRLIPGADQIQIDMPIAKVMDFLDLKHMPGRLRKEKEDRFFKYVEWLLKGDDFFEKGYLKDALNSYRESIKAAINPEQTIISLLKIGRTLERRQEYGKAIHTYQKILKFKKKKKLSDLQEAETYTLLAWMEYHRGNLDESEKLYFKALDLVRSQRYYKIMGNIFNGLGLIRKAQKLYPDALVFYQRALEYFSLVDYFYGIQGVYFNIGHIHKLKGDQYNKKDRIREYQKAMAWVKRCISLCQERKIANDTSQDHILMADLCLGVNNLNEAKKHIDIAIERASTAGNKRDSADSHRILGKIYITKGDQDSARSSFKKYIEYLEESGLTKDLIEAKKEIGNILK